MADRFLLVLWLTSRCNLHCSYCYADAGSHGQDMTFDTARQAIDAFRGRPLKIQFAGGEPTLQFPLMEAVCSYASAQNPDVIFQLQTNGTLLTDAMVERLKAWNISIGVSLDGIPEVNRLTRGQTAEAVRGIQLLGQHGVTVGLNAVVTAKTVRQLPKLVDFAFYLQNVGGIGLDLLRHAGRGCQEPDASSSELADALTAMFARTQELRRLFGVNLELREVALAQKRLAGYGNRAHYCYASCGRSAVVLPDGAVYPCGSLLSPAYCMGSCQSLQPESMLHLEAPVRSSCSSCSYAQVCPRGCPSRELRNHSDLECTLLKTSFLLAEKLNLQHGGIQ